MLTTAGAAFFTRGAKVSVTCSREAGTVSAARASQGTNTEAAATRKARTKREYDIFMVIH